MSLNNAYVIPGGPTALFRRIWELPDPLPQAGVPLRRRRQREAGEQAAGAQQPTAGASERLVRYFSLSLSHSLSLSISLSLLLNPFVLLYIYFHNV